MSVVVDGKRLITPIEEAFGYLHGDSVARATLLAQPHWWVKPGGPCRVCSEPRGSSLVEQHRGVCLTCQTLRELGLAVRKPSKAKT